MTKKRATAFFPLLAVIAADGTLEVKPPKDEASDEGRCLTKIIETWTFEASGKPEFLSLPLFL